jgi:S1-C subfamily serine protease
MGILKLLPKHPLHFTYAGILVLNAREGGPAWRSGIRGTSRDEYGRLVLGDIITAINGNKIRNSSDLYRLLDKSRVG